jgi:hypothetical protein
MGAVPALRVLTRLAATLAATFPGHADTPDPSPDFNGLYRPADSAPEDWACDHVGLEGGAWAVRGGQMIQVGRWCELDQPTPVTDMEAMLYDAVCFDDNGRTVRRLLLTRRPDGALWLVWPDGLELWLPCLPPA